MPMQQLTALVLPWRAAAAAMPMRLAHRLLWAGVLVGLWQLNRSAAVERWLCSSWPLLHPYWLPLLGVLLYALAWLGGRLWQAVRQEPAVGLCPDVDAAWKEATQLLSQSFGNPHKMPLFLVRGPLSAEVRGLFERCSAAAVVDRPAAPLRVFAQRQAIFVACDREQGPDAFAELCVLLRRDRGSCGIVQGVVLPVPLSALHSAAEVQPIIDACQDDLAVLRHATGLECPLYLAITGLDDVPCGLGQGWFQRFPLMPDCDREELADTLEHGLERMCQDALPQQIRQQLRLNTTPGTGTLTETLRDNIRQYHFLAQVQTWPKRLRQLFSEATANEYGEGALIAGCYFLPGPAQPVRECAVAAALWTDLLANRDSAAWTPETWEEREFEQRALRRGYVLILATWLSVLAMAGWLLLWR